MTLATVYCINWTEFERGWGSRPDGHTLHASKRTADVYRAAFIADLPAAPPHEYSHPSEPFAVEVAEDVAERVTKEGTIWGHVRQQLDPSPSAERTTP